MRNFALVLITLMSMLFSTNAYAAAVTPDNTTRTYSASEYVAHGGGFMYFQTKRGLEAVSIADISLASPNLKVTVDLQTQMGGKVLGHALLLVTGDQSDHFASLLALTKGMEDSKIATLPAEPQKLTTSYKDKDGLDHSIETPRNPNEGREAFIERHKSLVQAYVQAFPRT